eukprot:CAMPEP_0182875838 /NCGR_PEP_ID=MMETSP0034_2-20130328/13780_1 /TAXON_ID=156128 /ORGANISM="Nephroselmis pyriformis, Strain CCMP717" /LENGTH=78 /DNA_ID=CAMNT_0025008593 /DNA_START=304 /DNA_END=536 /DNA_ORIENTATION=+
MTSLPSHVSGALPRSSFQSAGGRYHLPYCGLPACRSSAVLRRGAFQPRSGFHCRGLFLLEDVPPEWMGGSLAPSSPPP